MGIHDINLVLDEDIDLSTAATTLSSESYDTQFESGNAGAIKNNLQSSQLDVGEPLAISLDITGDFGGTSATLQLALVSSANDDLSSAQVEIETRAIAAADLTYAAADGSGSGQNARIVVPVCYPVRTHLANTINRYLGAQVVVAGSGLTASVTGKIRIGLASEIFGQRHYASGITF